jgi:hypothetical protein
MAQQLIKIENEEWWISLIEDCQSILTEGIWNYRLTLIKTYHLLGKRILEENDNFERTKIYGKRLCNAVAVSLGKSERTIFQAIQFVKTFPNLDLLPEGKNISWHKICNNLLPVPKEDKIIVPEGKFSVLLADPPWTYRNVGVEGAVDKEYPTMTIQELCELPVKELVSENAVLFLWTTNPILVEFDNGKIWIPSFDELGKILSLIGQCEDEKYPNGKGLELVYEFFKEAILCDMSYEKFCKYKGIPTKL